ncbi:hypothetical protein BDR04DRAFT_1092039 [Suillus decipiens]|nr:hypothetical protein BDR04DRAFT_1092039 [Suillus decipiens]
MENLFMRLSLKYAIIVLVCVITTEEKNASILLKIVSFCIVDDHEELQIERQVDTVATISLGCQSSTRPVKLQVLLAVANISYPCDIEHCGKHEPQHQGLISSLMKRSVECTKYNTTMKPNAVKSTGNR